MSYRDKLGHILAISGISLVIISGEILGFFGLLLLFADLYLYSRKSKK